MFFDVYEYTNNGGRAYNEDAIGHISDSNSGVFVVADGLGGHKFGELASECVKNTFLSGISDGFVQGQSEWIKYMMATANQSILNMQAEKKEVLKSTAVVLTIDNGRAVWANVGDSRLYYIHDNRIQDVTNDHSVSFKKYKAGEISRDAIRYDDDQNRLLRTLGGKDHNEPEIYDKDIYVVPGDAFMLCSDGVWEYLHDEEILIDFLCSESSKNWAELLLTKIIARVDGDHDNLSVMAIKVEE